LPGAPREAELLLEVGGSRLVGEACLAPADIDARGARTGGAIAAGCAAVIAAGNAAGGATGGTAGGEAVEAAAGVRA